MRHKIRIGTAAEATELVDCEGLDMCDTQCTVCGHVQFDSPSGKTCPKGHGGDPGVPFKRPTSVEEFIVRFGDSVEPNSNCLENIACPYCSSRDRFSISCRSWTSFNDDGSDDVGDLEWDGDSGISCGDCGNDGDVRNFRFYGLDDKLRAAAQARRDK